MKDWLVKCINVELITVRKIREQKLICITNFLFLKYYTVRWRYYQNVTYSFVLITFLLILKQMKNCVKQKNIYIKTIYQIYWKMKSKL